MTHTHHKSTKKPSELRFVGPTLANAAELLGELPPSDERRNALEHCCAELKQAHQASAEAKATVENLSASRKLLQPVQKRGTETTRAWTRGRPMNYYRQPFS